VQGAVLTNRSSARVSSAVLLGVAPAGAQLNRYAHL
jgi:hypothetical protein